MKDFESLFEKKQTTEVHSNKHAFKADYMRKNTQFLDHKDFIEIAKADISDAQLNDYQRIQNQNYAAQEKIDHEQIDREYAEKYEAIQNSNAPKWVKNKKSLKLAKEKSKDERYVPVEVERANQRVKHEKQNGMFLLGKINTMNNIQVAMEGTILSEMTEEERTLAMNDPDILGLLVNEKPKNSDPNEIRGKKDENLKQQNRKMVNAFGAGANPEDIADAMGDVVSRLNEYQLKVPSAFASPNIDPASPLNVEKFEIYKAGFHAKNLLEKNPEAKSLLQKNNPEGFALMEKSFQFHLMYKSYLRFKTQNGISGLPHSDFPGVMKETRQEIKDLAGR